MSLKHDDTETAAIKQLQAVPIVFWIDFRIRSDLINI
jgi:hypothetical protein